MEAGQRWFCRGADGGVSCLRQTEKRIYLSNGQNRITLTERELKYSPRIKSVLYKHVIINRERRGWGGNRKRDRSHVQSGEGKEGENMSRLDWTSEGDAY